MKELIFQIETYAISQLVSKNIFNEPDVKLITDYATDNIVMNFRDRLLTKKAGTYRYKTPKTWLDHLKEDYKIIRKLLGNPNYTNHAVGVKVIVNPETYRIPYKQHEHTVILSSFDWDVFQNSPAETLNVHEVELIPIFYERHDD